MSELVPAILAENVNIYRHSIEIYNKFSKRIQIDICDGIFTAATTIDESNIWWSQGWAAIDIHMMVMYPSKHLDSIIKLKPSMCIFHAECGENLIPVFDQLHQAGIKCGVAILRQTYPGYIKSYLQAADHVLIFAGKLGHQGGDANLLQLEKAPIIRSIRPDIEIGWDGGANMTNIRAIAHGDIDVINIGSAISKSPDPAAAYNELNTEADRSGVLI